MCDSRDESECQNIFIIVVCTRAGMMRDSAGEHMSMLEYER